MSLCPLPIAHKRTSNWLPSKEMARASLPIAEHRRALLFALESSGVIILTGDTGSGKSTQVPQYLDEAGYTRAGCVVCTQPRAISAKALAHRVAEEMGVRVGREVGYSVRFEDCTSVVTRVVYMTDDMLLREMLVDPQLGRFSVVILDEAHERSMFSDLLLGLTLRLRQVRPSLKLIVSSATIEAERFAAYFTYLDKSPTPVNSSGDLALSARAQVAGGGGREEKEKEEEEEVEGGGGELRRVLAAALASKQAAKPSVSGGAASSKPKIQPSMDIPKASGAVYLGGPGVAEEEGPAMLRGAVEIVIAQPRKSRWSDAISSSSSSSSSTDSGKEIPPPPTLPTSPTNHKNPLPVRIFALEGRPYPVDIQYLSAPAGDFVTAAAQCAVEALLSQRESQETTGSGAAGLGDVLIFLPTKEHVRRCEESVASLWTLAMEAAGSATNAGRPGSASGGQQWQQLDILPLHSSLPRAMQMAPLEPPRLDRTRTPIPRVIIATSIAETSLTLPSVRWVIDSGWTSLSMFDPGVRVEAVVLVPVSKASAAQRLGRAGRCAPGTCFRLYTEATYRETLPHTHPPEIVRCDPCPAVLSLLALGVEDVGVRGFPYLDPPRPLALLGCLEYLFATRALTKAGCLTQPLGEYLSRLPVVPWAGVLLLSALRMGCAGEAASLVAMTAAQGGDSGSVIRNEDLFRTYFGAREGDHLALVNAFCAYRGSVPGGRGAWAAERGLDFRAMERAVEAKDHLWCTLGVLVGSHRQREQSGAGDAENEGCSGRLSLEPVAPESPGGVELALRKAVAAGLCHQAARLDSDGSYVTLREGHVAELHRGSILAQVSPPPSWIVYTEAVWNGERGKLQLQHCTAISPRWLLEVAGSMYALQGGVEGAAAAVKGAVEGRGGLIPASQVRFKSALERRREEEERTAAATTASAASAAAAAAKDPGSAAAGAARVDGRGPSLSAMLGAFLESGGGGFHSKK